VGRRESLHRFPATDHDALSPQSGNVTGRPGTALQIGMGARSPHLLVENALQSPTMRRTAANRANRAPYKEEHIEGRPLLESLGEVRDYLVLPPPI
jgi:hypothetical protein